MSKPTSTLELMAFMPEALNLATPWLISGLISTEAELIELTLKFQELITNENANNNEKTQDASLADKISPRR